MNTLDAKHMIDDRMPTYQVFSILWKLSKKTTGGLCMVDGDYEEEYMSNVLLLLRLLVCWHHSF